MNELRNESEEDETLSKKCGANLEKDPLSNVNIDPTNPVSPNDGSPLKAAEEKPETMTMSADSPKQAPICSIDDHLVNNDPAKTTVWNTILGSNVNSNLEVCVEYSISSTQTNHEELENSTQGSEKTSSYMSETESDNSCKVGSSNRISSSDDRKTKRSGFRVPNLPLKRRKKMSPKKPYSNNTVASAQRNDKNCNSSTQNSRDKNKIVEGSKQHFVSGMVVWATYGRKPSRYIGVVIPSIPRLQNHSPYHRNIFWFADRTVSRVATKHINYFLDKEIYQEKDEVPLIYSGIPDAVEVICDQYKMLGQVFKPSTVDQFITWVENQNFGDCDCYNIPTDILKELEIISNRGVEIDQEGGPSTAIENVQITRFPIVFDERDPQTLCLGCHEFTTSEAAHPLVDGILCRNCYMRVLENHMVLKLDQTHFRFCFVCGWLDKFVFCKSCKRVICRTCLMFWFKEDVYKTAARECFRWKCIFCIQPKGEETKYSKLVPLDVNTNGQVYSLPCDEAYWPAAEKVNLIRDPEQEKPALRVLSLFDGISTGMLALTNLGIKIDKYFASEIDNNAVMVTKHKFGDSVEHIGDIRKITSHSIKQYLPIHLLIGGSPCNDLSRVNHARKGLTDFDGSGSLFFEFYRVMKLIDDEQGHPRNFFYLFENVASMDSRHKNTISRFFESSPICIDAKYLAAMNRPRLFWGNIPQMSTLAKEFLLNKARDCRLTELQKHLTPNLRRTASVNRIRTVTTNSNSLNNNDGSPQVMMGGEASTLSVTEIESIFGFPEHYTDVMNLAPSTRRKLVGKAWCVQVIQAIFKPLDELFQLEHKE